MGAALYPIEPDLQEPDIGKRERSTVSQFERTPEQSLPRALSHIAELEAQNSHLQAELKVVREALARAEHTIAGQEQLLRNAQRREQELRAQLAQHMI